MQWSPTSTATERLAALGAIGGTVVSTIHTGLMQQLGQGMVEVISVPPGMSAEQAIRAYANRPGVELAENGGYTSGAVAAVNYYANMTSQHGTTAQYVGTNNSWGALARASRSQSRPIRIRSATSSR